jgi:hypothetical protein
MEPGHRPVEKDYILIPNGKSVKEEKNKPI